MFAEDPLIDDEMLLDFPGERKASVGLEFADDDEDEEAKPFGGLKQRSETEQDNKKMLERIRTSRRHSSNTTLPHD